MKRLPPLEVSDADRGELERRVRAHTSAQRDVKRARIVLLASEGVSNTKIAEQVGMDVKNVGRWRRKFAERGMPGLKDDPRPGGPPTYGHDDVLKIVAKVTESPPDPASHWSHSQLEDALQDEVGISRSQIGRILKSLDIKPHLVRGWITRRDDPNFWDRAADVCGLYLNPPENALVLSVDEKTGMSARSRTAPTTPPASGRASRQEFEYVRNGVVGLMAALDVHRGGILHATGIQSNDAQTFIAFLKKIDRKVSKRLDVHLVLDNGSSHIAKATVAWLDEHPRFHVHHTPNHASWLNQVELFFSILARRLLKRGEFDSPEDLVAKIMAFIADYNLHAKPFRWTYEGKPLKVA